MFHKEVKRLQQLVDEVPLRFAALGEATLCARTIPGQWSKKERLGHLIDLAANCHQQLVRLQYEKNARIVFDAEEWVLVQNYQNEPTKKLLMLWEAFNSHLLYLIDNIPETAAFNPGLTEQQEPVTLAWLVQDYIRQLNLHIRLIFQDEHAG